MNINHRYKYAFEGRSRDHFFFVFNYKRQPLKKKKKKEKKKKERKKERKDTSKNTIRCKFSLAEEEYSLLRSKQRQLGKGRDEREK